MTVRVTSGRRSARVDVSVVEHLAICDALLRGNADTAAARTADHLADSVATIFCTLTRGPGADLDPLGQRYCSLVSGRP